MMICRTKWCGNLNGVKLDSRENSVFRETVVVVKLLSTTDKLYLVTLACISPVKGITYCTIQMPPNKNTTCSRQNSFSIALSTLLSPENDYRGIVPLVYRTVFSSHAVLVFIHHLHHILLYDTFLYNIHVFYHIESNIAHQTIIQLLFKNDPYICKTLIWSRRTDWKWVLRAISYWWLESTVTHAELMKMVLKSL